MDRCALFVDAGYVLADGAMAVHGTRRRESVSWDYAGLLQLLAGLAAEQSALPLLRCYWYEATVEGRRGADHDALADLPGVKLRLAKMRPGRREGVESEIHRDLEALARNKAITDAMVVSAEEDLAGVIADVQDLGLRVTMLHITVDGNWTISRALRQECDDIVEISASHLRPYVELISGAEPSAADDHEGAALALLRPGTNGHGANGRGGDGTGSTLLAPAASSGGRLPSFTPAPPATSGNGNGYQFPPAIYTEPVVAEYQRAVPPPSAPQAPGASGLGGPGGPGTPAGEPSGASADDAGTTREEPAPASPALGASADGGMSPLGQGEGPQGGPVPAARYQTAPPYAGPLQPDFPLPGLIQPAPGPAQSGPQEAVQPARPGFTPAGQDYSAPEPPAPNGHPDLPAQDAPPHPEVYSAPVAVQGPGAQGTAPVPPMGMGAPPAYVIPDFNGYRPGATREPAFPNAGHGDMATVSPLGAPEAAPVPAGPGAQVRRLPTRGPAGAIPPAVAPAPAQHAQLGQHAQPGQPQQSQPQQSQAPAVGQPRGAQPHQGQPHPGQPLPLPPAPAAPGGFVPGGPPAYSGPQLVAPVAQPALGQPPVGQPALGQPSAGPPPGSQPSSGPQSFTHQPGPAGYPNPPAPDPAAPGTSLAPIQGSSFPNGQAQPPQPLQQSQPAISLADAVQSAHEEGQKFGGTVARDAPALWLEAVLARKPRMPSDLEARLLQGSSLPIDFLLHDEVRHALRRGFWDALERARR